jgi:NAD(P)-dependent dehydrogenase (short-subunit alcohol dehydrogenase family)
MFLHYMRIVILVAVRDVALVTGGGRGIGRAIAVALARAGMDVGVTARTASELAETVSEIEASGGRAVAAVADAGSPADVRTAVCQIRDELGEMALLVNNAGVNRSVGPSWEVDPEIWWEDVTVNLRGPFLFSREVLPSMVEARRGHIINIVSGTAGRPYPYNTAYSCSKTALARFSDSLAEETRPHGVSVFALGPGTVRTSMATGVLGSDQGRRWLGGIDDITFISPDRVCDAVVFLAGGGGDALSGRCLFATDDIPGLAAEADQIVERQLYQLRVAKID